MHEGKADISSSALRAKGCSGNFKGQGTMREATISNFGQSVPASSAFNRKLPFPSRDYKTADSAGVDEIVGRSQLFLPGDKHALTTRQFSLPTSGVWTRSSCECQKSSRDLCPFCLFEQQKHLGQFRPSNDSSEVTMTNACDHRADLLWKLFLPQPPSRKDFLPQPQELKKGVYDVQIQTISDHSKPAELSAYSADEEKSATQVVEQNTQPHFHPSESGPSSCDLGEGDQSTTNSLPEENAYRLLVIVRRLPDRIVPLFRKPSGRSTPATDRASRRDSTTIKSKTEVSSWSEKVDTSVAAVEGSALSDWEVTRLDAAMGSEFFKEDADFSYNLTLDDISGVDWVLERNEFGLDFFEAFPRSVKKAVVADPNISFPRLSKDPKVRRVLQESLSHFLEQYSVIPVFVDENETASTERYSEEVIAPLFHHRLPPLSTGFHDLDWDGYVALNKVFLDVVVKHATPSDWILVLNYHLMLLPRLLRENSQTCNANIAFYLTTVFPSSEMYRILPQREQLLRGVLAATFIGFHSFQYKRHFLTACTRIIGVECSGDRIEPNANVGGGAGARVVTVPRGINCLPWLNALKNTETLTKLHHLRERFKGRKVLVGIDPLDYTRGIPNKMLAFHKMLSDNPEWASRIVFLQVCVPKNHGGPLEQAGIDQGNWISKVDRKEILSKVYQLVGAINAQFGNILTQPVHFLLGPLSVENLICLYGLADIFVLTPLRESLSWTAYQYILCQAQTNKGVIVLSEFSGSAQSLGAAALCVNPWNPNAMAAAFLDALEMSTEEKLERHVYAYDHVLSNDMNTWGTTLLSEFKEAITDLEAEKRTIPLRLSVSSILTSAFSGRTHRFLIFGFRGTLVPTSYKGIDSYFGGRIRMNRGIEMALNVLSYDKNTSILVVSSAGIQQLDQIAVALPSVTFMAENGHYERRCLTPEALKLMRRPASLPLSGPGRMSGQRLTPLIEAQQTNDPARSNPVKTSLETFESQDSIDCPHPASEEAQKPPPILSNGHGKERASPWVLSAPEVDLSWMDPCEETCRYFEQRTPGSIVYRTATSIAFNYANAQREHGASQARDLLIHLWAGAATLTSRTEVVVGPHSVEVRSAACTKALATERWIRETASEKNIAWSKSMVLCVSNFLPRDEDVFATLERLAESPEEIGSASTLKSRFGSSVETTSQSEVINEKDQKAEEEHHQYSLDHTELYKKGPAKAAEGERQEMPDVSSILESKNAGVTDKAMTQSADRDNQDSKALTAGGIPSNAGDLLNANNENNSNVRLVTCTMGLKPSRAKNYLADEKELERLLTNLATQTILADPEMRQKLSERSADGRFAALKHHRTSRRFNFLGSIGQRKEGPPFLPLKQFVSDEVGPGGIEPYCNSPGLRRALVSLVGQAQAEGGFLTSSETQNVSKGPHQESNEISAAVHNSSLIGPLKTTVQTIPLKQWEETRSAHLEVDCQHRLLAEGTTLREAESFPRLEPVRKNEDFVVSESVHPLASNVRSGDSTLKVNPLPLVQAEGASPKSPSLTVSADKSQYDPTCLVVSPVGGYQKNFLSTTRQLARPSASGRRGDQELTPKNMKGSQRTQFLEVDCERDGGSDFIGSESCGENGTDPNCISEENDFEEEEEEDDDDDEDDDTTVVDQSDWESGRGNSLTAFLEDTQQRKGTSFDP